MKSDVKIWEQKVSIPTYGVGKPDKNPMFLEKRVYQGSSGVVYPFPVIDKIKDEKKDAEHEVVFLENEYLKIMIMPSFGGRIQMAYDKTNDFHFVYYNRVIKPALVGLAGPWISGGIEFNWPQHHRPSTYEPVDFSIEENPDGSKTLWVSEIERMSRTKSLTGFTLHPAKAYLEINVRLYNRTAEPQSFLWWANPAMHVDDNYQSIFPPDVHAVYDHGKRDVSGFPIATGEYYKIDYSGGVDISRFKNIPVPTSFMAAGSNYDFMGGYDHGKQAGMLHFADRHISPGKKQWVWGCGDFGDAWHRNLTDEDGPYVELMTGVYTDNQPDFSWLMPYEEKSFTQYFFPYKLIGAVKNANSQAAVNLEIEEGRAYVGVYVTSIQNGLTIELSNAGKVYFEETVDLDPSSAFSKRVEIPSGLGRYDWIVRVFGSKRHLLVSSKPEDGKLEKIPSPAQAIGEPQEIRTIEELYLAGMHLEQYRHATYRPEPYYLEALSRDPGDLRCNNAMGLLLYRQGQFEKAESYFRTAISRQTKHNPNPYCGEAYYNLGLCLRMQGRIDEAYDAFFKSTWNAAKQDCGYFAIGQIACLQKDYTQALGHVEKSLIRNYHNHKARHLKTALLRKLGQLPRAAKEALFALELDRLDFGAMNEIAVIEAQMGNKTESCKRYILLENKIRDNVQNYIEISIDYAQAGLFDDAIEFLSGIVEISKNKTEVYPMAYYYLGYYYTKKNDDTSAHRFFEKAAKAKSDYCFPNRIESIVVLQEAIRHWPDDSKAWYYLGNLWYSKRQYDLGIEAWEKSIFINPTFATAHRNLGLAYFNKRKDSEKAQKAYKTAFLLDTTDARVLYELDQLSKKVSITPQCRRVFLEKYFEVVTNRDDLYIEYIWLLNHVGDYEKAFCLLLSHQFHPWEGGEGKVTGAYVFSLIEIAKQHITAGRYEKSIECLQRTEKYPDNLGEGKLHGCRENDIHYYLGLAFEGLGQIKKANEYFTKATEGIKDIGNTMYYNDQPADKIFYQGLAFGKINDEEKAKSCFNRLLSYGKDHYFDEMKIDYFAVSLPDFLVFDEDLTAKNKINCSYLMGLGYLGLNMYDKAQVEFDKILTVDPSHSGAIVHVKMMHPVLALSDEGFVRKVGKGN